MLQESLLRESLFTSDVSHELRTPLMVIKSSCELLIAKDQLDDYTRQRIETINKATREIQELVDAFLTLARGKDTEQESTSLTNVIQKTLGEWRQQAEEKGLTFTLEENSLRHESPDELFPAPLLRTVLNNLIFNAIHHTKEGIITLSIQPTGFSVSDTGSGISESEKQAVFKPFYRGESHSRKGLGLGLSLVQRICQREDWEISISDNQPIGSCFTVSLKK
jgi:signal transduction histidine kinase